MKPKDENEIAVLDKNIAGLENEIRIQYELIKAQKTIITTLEYSLKAANAEIQAFKYGKKYPQMGAERQRDALMDKVTEQRHRIYDLETELEESKTIRYKKVCNNMERTGRKPGGQPGHKGHCRKKQTPTMEPILLPQPPEVLNDADFKKTSKTLVKQLINVRLILDVTEYHADVYYNSKTGERIHASFPAGVVDDVNYGGSVKAFLFLLNNDCCTSIDKSRKFLSDLTDGKLNISKGMINKLSKEFAIKSGQKRKEMFADILLSPVMHTDCTNAKINGKNSYVFVCATPEGKALYFARDKKGHEGVKGTPVEDYQGILIHNHDKTFYNYGTEHQECLAHILRCLRESINNEPDRIWNKSMRSLVQEMIRYRNCLPAEMESDTAKVSEFERRYREILQKAKEEYEYIPPDEYYKDGYNLYLRMEEYMSSHLLFLHDHRVPATNNEAERLLRSYKRKQQQAMSFRSPESIDDLCGCMSMLIMMRQKEEQNIFDRISRIFG